jgi:hypothetical protein
MFVIIFMTGFIKRYLHKAFEESPKNRQKSGTHFVYIIEDVGDFADATRYYLKGEEAECIGNSFSNR